MVQALNSVASALIEALRVPDLISVGIVKKFIFLSHFYEDFLWGLHRWSGVSYFKQAVKIWDLRGYVLIWADKTVIYLFVCNIDVWSGKKLLTFRILCCSKFECPKVAIKRETRAESECFADEHKWWFYSEAGFTGKVLTSPPTTWEKWNLLALPNFFSAPFYQTWLLTLKREQFCRNICSIT